VGPVFTLSKPEALGEDVFREFPVQMIGTAQLGWRDLIDDLQSRGNRPISS
jgi:hypothetical protein